jgi:hypothetical protein
MKNLMTLAVLAAAVQLAGCRASAPLASTCQTQPSSFLTGDDGKPNAAIFPCYRADGVMTYQARPLTPDEVKSVTAALAPAAAPKIDPAVGAADPCSAKEGLDYTVCRKAQHRKPKALKAVK